MTTFKEAFQQYDSAYLRERRALGDELSDDAHAAIEAILHERGEPVPPRPQQPIRVDGAKRGRASASTGRTVGLLLLAVAALGVAKMLAHTWIGGVIGLGALLYMAVDWIRRRNLTPAQRDAAQQAKLVEDDGLTELMQCAADGELARVKDLLNYDAPVNAKSLRGTTALMYAARNNHLEIAKALVIAGADVNLRSDANSTALSIATKFGHQALADFLRQHGAHERSAT
ncbi:ankyrin repeat domain-containing protein [Cupriavidus sp. TMH.W2]|uniref:ankyrin repeat domain-containing protein n=1 Tax=Cupriavidus sp. TMH.W2 TaxID=3434465 RepID=UPI003D78AEC5